MLRSLGGLHCLGASVDFGRACGAGRPHRQVIDLPPYPWQRERYWVPVETRPTSASRSARGAGPSDHPLLGVRVELADTTDRLVWESALDRRDVPYVHDHRLEGRRVVSASTFLAVAGAAAAEALGIPAFEVADVLFERPLVFEADQERTELQTGLRAAGGDWRFAIHSRVAGSWVRHVTGLIRPTSSSGLGPPPAPGQGAWVTGAEFYGLLDAAGIELHGLLRSVARVRLADGVAEAEIAWPGALGRAGAVAPVSPVLLDPCLQLTAALLPPAGGAFHTPSGIARFRLGAPVQVQVDGSMAPLVALARLRDADDRTAVVDLWLLQESRVVASFEGVQLAETGRSTAVSSDIESWFYRYGWQPSAAPVEGAGARDDGAWLILPDGGGLGRALAARLAAHGVPCRVITASNGDERRGVADPDVAERIRKAIADVTDAGGVCRGIVHLGAVDARLNTDRATATDLESVIRRGAGELLQLVQVVASAPPPVLRLWVATRGVHAVRATDTHDTLGPALAQAPLWGLGRAIAEEHRDSWGGLIDLDPGAGDDAAAAAIVSELLRTAPDREDEIRVQGNRPLRGPADARAPDRGGDPAAAVAIGCHLPRDRWLRRSRTRGRGVDGGPGRPSHRRAGTYGRAGARRMVVGPRHPRSGDRRGDPRPRSQRRDRALRVRRRGRRSRAHQLPGSVPGRRMASDRRRRPRSGDNGPRPRIAARCRSRRGCGPQQGGRSVAARSLSRAPGLLRDVLVDRGADAPAWPGQLRCGECVRGRAREPPGEPRHGRVGSRVGHLGRAGTAPGDRDPAAAPSISWSLAACTVPTGSGAARARPFDGGRARRGRGRVRRLGVDGPRPTRAAASSCW